MVKKYTDDPLSPDKDNKDYLFYDIAHTDKLYTMLDAPDDEEITIKRKVINWPLFFLIIATGLIMFLSTYGAIRLWEALG